MDVSTTKLAKLEERNSNNPNYFVLPINIPDETGREIAPNTGTNGTKFFTFTVVLLLTIFSVLLGQFTSITPEFDRNCA